MVSIAHYARVLKSQLEDSHKILSDSWGQDQIESACRDCGHHWRERVWNPLQTVWTFLLQVLWVDSSCRAAVAMTLGQWAAKQQSLDCSPDPSAYCQARQRLPLEVIRRGVKTVGQRLREKVGSRHLWCGRRVWMVDGSSCSMPDTPSLQKAFGQPSGQAPGCGFPVAKIVAMFCWASGAVLDAAVGPWWSSELLLWRRLWYLLPPGDVVLGDRYYCSFGDLAGLRQRGVDGVFRLHQRRPADFRCGQRLGREDRLVTWRRPLCPQRPRGMTVQQWRLLPEELTVRLLRVHVNVAGFRSRVILVATTLLDPVAYPAERIAALYRDRWTVELRLREIKTTLGMDVLRGHSPDIVGKEIYLHLLAYNLIRTLMWQAAAMHGRDLHRLSFAGTVDRLNALLPYLWLYQGTAEARRLYALLLEWIAHEPLPHRPNRMEPRAVKRRPKEYALLNKPRAEMRKALVG
jgi:hypothetical protein